MDINALIESVGYPMAAIIIAVAILIAAVRVNCNVQLADWLRLRDERKKESDRKKFVENCRHAWTLYPNSPYSSCNYCGGIIATSTLLIAHQAQLSGLRIHGEAPGYVLKPGQHFRVSDPVGKQ